jgi:hypothetical protein
MRDVNCNEFYLNFIVLSIIIFSYAVVTLLASLCWCTITTSSHPYAVSCVFANLYYSYVTMTERLSNVKK